MILATVFSLGLQVLHDDQRYHFDNPSSFDTTQLVPHFFEQRYSGTKEMLVLRAGGFEAAVSGVKRLRGSDYDTFFQPSGDVVVHGTTTDVDTRSWRLAWHRGIAGIAYSHDAMRFPDSISTTTHTMPPSTTSGLSTTRENTSSDVLELRVSIRSAGVSPAGSPASRRLVLSGGIDLSPLTFARLTTNLPDKYPQPVRFSAVAFGARATGEAEWRADRFGVALEGEIGQTWALKKSKSFKRQQAAATVLFTWR